MRRALAITLLVALFAPALVPSISALTADPEANLPPCCRSHGAHHCAMMHWMLQQLDGRPRFTPAPCSQYPAAATVPQLATFTLSAAPQLARGPVDVPTVVTTSARRAQLLLARTRRDRGPPVRFA